MTKVKRISSVLLALMILLSSIPVYAQDGSSQPVTGNGLPPQTGLGSQPADISTPSALSPALDKNASSVTTILPEEARQQFSQAPQEAFPGAMCAANDLTPQESNAILDLLKDGFTGDQLSGDAKPEETNDFKTGDRQRDELQNKNLILENPAKEGEAVKAEIPSKELEPFEVSNWLNTYVSGPFAFGLVLSDTVRAGRCRDANTTDCFLVGKNLKYRNDGTGIVDNTRPLREIGASAAEKIKSIFVDENTQKNPLAFESDEQQALAAGLFNDVNDVSLKTAQRVEKSIIANSILTNDFKAKMGTNCIDDQCVISTYSMFDKYFNQWMSNEMVISNFGPSLLGKTKKMFGWITRRVDFVRGPYDKIMDWFRLNFESPGSLLGDLKLNRMHQRVARNSWGDWYQSLTIGNSDGTGYPLVKTQEFLDWWGKQQIKGGFLDSIDTVEKKAEFIRVLRDLRTAVRSGEAQVGIAEGKYKNVIGKLINEGIANPYEHPEGKKALVDYGRQFGKWVQHMDDQLGLDGPDWFVRHPNLGFYNKGVRQINTGEVIDLFQEHRNSRIIIDKFVDSGNWKNFENEAFLYRGAYETDGAGNLILYGFDESNAKYFGHVEPHDLLHNRNINDLWAKTDHGEFVKASPTSAKFINARNSQVVNLYQGNWAPVEALTPEEFSLRLTNPRVRPNFQKAVGNVDKMLDTVKERNWISRRYWSALDKLMAQEDELIRSYFSLRGGIKWTAYPFGYWWAKRGAGIEDLSTYQLPDTWSYIFIKHGTQEVFDYAYVDFFANAGSDQGDIFIQVLNALPWKLILDEVSDKFNPIKNFYDKLSGRQLRNEVENIAFYLTGPSECENCFMKIESDADFQNFRPFFVVKNKQLSSYILEDTQSVTAKESGQTLIAFAHKTNLAGKSGDVSGEEINLVEAIRNEPKEGEEVNAKDKPLTCKAAIKSLPGYSTVDKIVPYLTFGAAEGLPDDEKIGAVLFGAETLTYATFFWPGIFSSVAIQTLYAPKLQDCVDADEGYFIHYFMAAKKEEKKDEQNKVELSTEKVSELISKLKNSLTGSFQGDQNSLTKKGVADLGKEIDKFVKDAEDTRIVQAKLDISGTSAAQFKGIKLFYFWCGPGCEVGAGEYRTVGHEKITDKTGKNDLDFDYQNGQLLKNGVPIVSNPDAVRLARTDTKIPGKEIPRRLNIMCVEPTEQVGIEVRANGEAIIQSDEILRCIQSAVMAQTGLPLATNNLSQAFGLVQSVGTTTHPNIGFLGTQIVAEGIPRKIADGSAATLRILNNRKAVLSHSNDGITETGLVNSIQFQNGQMIVKPDGCYVVWLRHHQDGILNQNDIAGLKPKLTTSINPENGCPEPAIDLSAIPKQGSTFISDKVEKFNTSLEKMGPFQVFETPTKRYVLFSEKDTAGVCRDHLKVIDKETGKVEDYTGTATQTPTGIEFTTDDGKTHTLDFAAPNGVPQVSFDGKAPETLTSAQGRNGTFWYDPNTGLWYADNAQLLPLIEAFRDGIATKVGPDNTTTSNASGNVLNVKFGQDEGGFLNLPSVPENKWLLLAFSAALISAFAVSQAIIIRKRQKSRKWNN